MRGRERQVGERRLLGLQEHVSGRPRDLQHLLGRLLVARPHEDGALLREDGLHGLARLSLVVLPVDAARHVAHEVRDAALPGRSLERLGYRLREPFVGVRDDEAHAVDAARPQAGEERLPPGVALRVHAVHADEALVARVVEPDRGHDGLGRRAPLHAALHVGGVEPQVGEAHPVEALPPERVHLGVQALAQARHLRLRHRPHAELARDGLHLARRYPHDVHLGHRRDERPVHPAVALDQVLGEERASAQLRNLEGDVARGGREPPLPVAVARVDAPLVALPVGGVARLVGLRRHRGVRQELEHPAPEGLQVGAFLEDREREPLHFGVVE